MEGFPVRPQVIRITRLISVAVIALGAGLCVSPGVEAQQATRQLKIGVLLRYVAGTIDSWGTAAAEGDAPSQS